MMSRSTLLGLFAAVLSVRAAHEYCGDCGCFNDAEYALLLGMLTSSAAPGPTALAAFETVTADGIRITIGSNRAIMDGLTYSIGAGVSPVTVLLDAELFTFGPRGVVAPTTTFAPFFPAMATTSASSGGPAMSTTLVGTEGNVVANGTATILVPAPATASSSNGASLGHTTTSRTSSVSLPQGIPTVSSSSSPTSLPGLSPTTSTTPPIPPPTSTSSAMTDTTATTEVTSISTSTPPTPPTTIPSSVPTTPVQTTNLNQLFIDSVLQATNQYRAINQANPVVWDPVKAQYAQTYANLCNFKHSGGQYGENLAIGGYSNPALYVWYWYDEINAYNNYTAPDLTQFKSWGHFTQLVWEGTTSIGCGYATECFSSAYGQYYLVCEYDTGNVLPASNFVANVLPPTETEPAQPAGEDSAF